MKKFFDENKWVVLSALALVVVAAIVIGICVGAGNGEKDPNPTEGTSNVATDPTGTTGGNGNEVTDPSDPSDTDDPSDPSDVTEPTGTPENPAKPDNPEKPDDYVEPTEPDETIPDPTEPDELPDVTEPDDPDVGPEYNFEGYTMGTITTEAWESWDWGTREAFVREFYTEDTTPEEYHHFMVQTVYGGYSCGFEKHTCTDADQHEWFMGELAEGCVLCGSSDCPSFFTVDPQTLFIHMDITACPEYDIHNDPEFYCQTCGLPTSGKSGEAICITCIAPTHCPYCKADMEVDECHHCTQP